jgi:AcrR family transcriptional regulator
MLSQSLYSVNTFIWYRDAVALSLRERKKLETHRSVWQTALQLFEERGFDNVTVAEIAAAANVSKMTVFNYFPTKEDLVFAPMEEHIEDLAKVVRERRADETVIVAMRRYVLERLAARDPVSGLNDSPGISALRRLVMSTPSLEPRLRSFVFRTQAALVQELAKETDQLTAQVVAAQIVGARGVLMLHIAQAITAGRSADDIHPEAVEQTHHVFDLLEQGIRI